MQHEVKGLRGEELCGARPGQQPGEAPTSHIAGLPLAVSGFTQTLGPVKVNLVCCLFVFSKNPYICSMDLLGCSVLNIKCRYGPRKVQLFHSVWKNVVDGLEELLRSQANTIHARTSRSPLLNKVLS